ncbi:MAG: pilus assembly protein CpaE [Actinomycetota bacterium]|jgi:pilus assembly protein CpaE
MLGRRERRGAEEATSSSAVQIVVVEEEPFLVERVTKLFSNFDVRRVGHVDDAIKTARQPTVVIIGPDNASAETLERVDTLRHAESASLVTVLLVVESMSTAILRQAMRAGVSDVLPQSCKDPELADLVRSGIERVENRAFGPDGERRGRVVAVFSPKGGAGTTTIAVNLAIAASRGGGSGPILVDADLPFGDVAITLGLDPTQSLADATGADMDQLRLRGVLVTEKVSGLRCLLAPPDPARAEVITAADVTRTLELCRQIAPLVVVDTSSAFDEVTLSILDQADDVVVVASADVTTVKNAKIALDTLHRLGVAESHTYLVLNRVPARPLLAVGDVERVLGLKAHIVPEDEAVSDAAHAGRPLVRDARSKAAKAIAALAVQFEELSPANSTR